MNPLSDEIIAGLSPGIRDLVIRLNSLGFYTTDSGDGSNFAAGMEGALPVPMVAVKTTRLDFFQDSHRLQNELDYWYPDAWSVQASYDPRDHSCLLLATKGAP